MIKIRDRIVLLFAGILIFVISAGGIRLNAEGAAQKKAGRILFISSYNYGWDTVQSQIEGIKDGAGNETTIDYEFMDTKRVNDETSARQFYEGLKYRMSKVEPYDVVILGDDAALLFAMEYRDELFADIPLVFEGINDEELALKLSEDPLITGVLEKLSVEKNIEFARNLIPNAKKVIAILDDSVTGEAERKRFFSYQESYPELEFLEINASELTSSKLKQKINQVGSDSILIYVTMTEDADGKQYSNKEAVKFICTSARVPVFRMVEAGIGEGILGGNVVSMHKSGEIAANIAVDIINGKKSGDIGVIVDSPNVYCVDQLVMEKYELNVDLIPEGTEIVNYQASFWKRNKEVVRMGGILVAALLIVILVCVIDNFRKRKLLKELEVARGIMESASQHDFLTGIPNRSKFMEDLQKTIEAKIPCTIMMIDIDEFKKINDTYGHTAGDEALKEVAARLKALQSQILTPYRFAGDEFIILIKSKQSKIVDKTAFQLKELFNKSFMLAGEARKVCGSIGIASYPKDTEDLEQLIVCADHAMYKVKKSGKNNFAYYEPNMTD